MRIFCVLIIVLFGSFSLAINPNELKPCFERYDGFKIVNAVPFHSEWRMKAEEWCLEFCIRAASRCVSIVYDKYSKICHYFTINGIEEEKIGKHPRMVYFQVAEKQCAERMQMKIDQEELWRQQQFERQFNNTTRSTLALTTSESLSVGDQLIRDDEILFPKLEPETTTIEATTTSPKSTQTTSTTPQSTTVEISTSTNGEDAELDGDPMNFVSRFQFENEGASETASSIDPDSESENITVLTTTETSTQQTETETMSSSTITTTELPSTTKKISTTPKLVDPVKNLADNAAAILPVMNGFKAVRRPLPQKTEVEVDEKKPEMIDVRRSPIKSIGQAQSINQHYTGKRPFDHKVDENVSPIEDSEDDETMLADNTPVIDDCSGGMQEIWLAVENSQVNSTIRTSVIKVASQPLECMEACQTLFIGKHPCDSFTFIEPAKRCIFHSSHAGFQVKPSALNDFSTRAFRRFCYPESLTPFSECAEFLAFRDYSLDIAPREIFENLPLGNEGISACIELCVLSHEFRCKSASFNSHNGTCTIYDEHSLTQPSGFKPNTDPNLLYFENGCVEMKIPESALKQSKIQRVQPVLLDYRKLSMN